MAEQKELRRMNRTELIEIIYALQQQEIDLRRENKELADRLEDRAIRLDSSGSIAEAALSLSHIFEDAQAAADQYLMSVTSAVSAADGAAGDEAEPERTADAAEEAARLVDGARDEAARVVSAAETEAARLVEEAQLRSKEIRKEADRIVEEAQAESEKIRRKASRAVEEEKKRFLCEVRNLLTENPELAAALRNRSRIG